MTPELLAMIKDVKPATDEEIEAIATICRLLANKTEADQYLSLISRIVAERKVDDRKFRLGDRVRKSKGASWQGVIVGFYSTTLTPIGYAVESEREPGSVQIYPEAALEPL